MVRAESHRALGHGGVLALRLFIWAAMTYAPDKVHGPEIGLLAISVILPTVHLWTLRAAVRAK